MSTLAVVIGGTPAAASTTVAAASDGAKLPRTTINVASTTGFGSTGSFLVLTDADGFVEIFYTGKTGTSFTGCTNGVGTISVGTIVKTPPAVGSAQGGQQPSSPVINVGFDVTGGSDYTAGGYDFDPATKLQKLAGYDKAPINVAVLSEKKLVAAHVYEWSYDRVNGKLILLKDGANDNGTGDVSAVGAIRVLVMAR